MALRTEYCEDYVLFGMEKKQRKVVFGLQVFEGLSQGEGNRWGLRGAQETELCDLWTRRNSLADSPWAALQRSKESGCLWEVTERALEKTGQVRAGLLLPRREGWREESTRGTWPAGPAPSCTGFSPPNLWSSTPISLPAAGLPASTLAPLQPILHSATRVRPYKTAPAAKNLPVAAHRPLVQVQIYFSSLLPPFYSLKTEQR